MAISLPVIFTKTVGGFWNNWDQQFFDFDFDFFQRIEIHGF